MERCQCFQFINDRNNLEKGSCWILFSSAADDSFHIDVKKKKKKEEEENCSCFEQVLALTF